MEEGKNKVITSITLLDGTVLPCEPLGEGEKPVPNRLMWDEQLHIYLPKDEPEFLSDETEALRKEVRKTGINYFAYYATTFLAYRDVILRDSRMFLAPVPMPNSLMPTGEEGFERPTLGVYIEFWLHCTLASKQDEEGNWWLVFGFKGSAYSGSNQTFWICEDGRHESVSIDHFLDMALLFRDTNQRYSDAKKYCRAYSLPEVIDLLDMEEVE